MRQERNASSESIGLAGMAKAVLVHRQIWACRPFLDVERASIRNYLAARDQGWFDDPSNESVAFERVRVRHSIADDCGVSGNDVARRRVDLSVAAADWINRAVNVHRSMLISIDRQCLNEDRDVASYALSYLAAIVGGRPYPLGRERIGRLFALASEETNGRMSAHRVVFDIRKDKVYLYRELRNLPFAPNISSLPAAWDERFWVHLSDSKSAEVSPVPKEQWHVPPMILRRAQLAMPFGEDAHDYSSDYRIVPRLRPFEQFLPLFDHAYATAVARAFDCHAYLPVPFIEDEPASFEKAESF